MKAAFERPLHVSAAQVGPILKDEPREETVERLIYLMEEVRARPCSRAGNTPHFHIGTNFLGYAQFVLDNN